MQLQSKLEIQNAEMKASFSPLYATV